MAYLLRAYSPEELVYYNVTINNATDAAFKAGPPNHYSPAILQLALYSAALATALVCGGLALKQKQYAGVLTSFWLCCSNVAEVVIFAMMVTSAAAGKVDRDLIDISANLATTLTPVLMSAVTSTALQLIHLAKPRSSGTPNRTDAGQNIAALGFMAFCLMAGCMMFGSAMPDSVQSGAVFMAITWFLGGVS